MTKNPLQAPFPYFGGKSKAAAEVWSAFGTVKNYVEPFAGSIAVLLAAPEGKRVETVNDLDGFVINFWRSIAHDPQAVAHYADWPVSELDLHARHGWLINRSQRLRWSLEDPDYYDPKIAGWWVWGACSWIGWAWCTGVGPWVSNGAHIKKLQPGQDNEGEGCWMQKPGLSAAGRGIKRNLPHLSTRQGVHRSTTDSRKEFNLTWFDQLSERLKDVRVTCGDWQRVTTPSVTTRHGLTAMFLDPPYTTGYMDYAAGGVGSGLAQEVQAWCAENGSNPLLRVVLCGHAGEHDALLAHGWHARPWSAKVGYAKTTKAIANYKSETLWCSPHCQRQDEASLFAYSDQEGRA